MTGLDCGGRIVSLVVNRQTRCKFALMVARPGTVSETGVGDAI